MPALQVKVCELPVSVEPGVGVLIVAFAGAVVAVMVTVLAEPLGRPRLSATCRLAV